MRCAVVHTPLRSSICVLFAVVGLAAAGCSCGPERIAELREARGIVDRDDAAEGENWQTTVVGETYTWDEAVRTAPDATASLLLGRASGLRMQPGTIVRFLRQASDRTGVQIASGEAELESQGDVSLITRAGTVQLASGTTIRLRAGPAERIEVVAGRVQFEDGRTVEVGQAVLVEVGSVILEETATPDAAVASSEPDAGVPPPDAFVESPDAFVVLLDDPGSAESAIQPSPTRAHIALSAGESATVHDISPPTAVRLDLPASCTGQAVVTVASGPRGVRYAGTGSVIVSVPAGRFRYTIRCQGGQAPAGTLTVRRDDGSLRLESVPPRNVFDADGRNYHVLYQNALPIVTFRWNQAGGGPYQVVVESGGRSRTLSADGRSYTFVGGELRDGEHRLTYVAGGRRSPTTTVRIRFDNAAPTAHIREPRGAVARGSVRVAGQVIEGASVSVGGAPLTLDGDNRFEGDAVVPADLDALAIRFAHPRSGVHYYLRRVAP
jgi:hypothetical protein